MNNKILLEVYVPMLEEEYDVFVPIYIKIANVTRLINEAIVDLSSGSFPLKKDILLYNRSNGLMLDPKCNVKEAGLVNGSQVILI